MKFKKNWYLVNIWWNRRVLSLDYVKFCCLGIVVLGYMLYYLIEKGIIEYFIIELKNNKCIDYYYL